jgi:hypothetical protein
MSETEPSANAVEIASAIRASGDAATGRWDLVAKHHAEEISGGLRDATEVVADAIEAGVSDGFLSGAELDRDGGKANVTDGLFAIARALDQIAEAIRLSNKLR